MGSWRGEGGLSVGCWTRGFQGAVSRGGRVGSGLGGSSWPRSWGREDFLTGSEQVKAWEARRLAGRRGGAAARVMVVTGGGSVAADCDPGTRGFIHDGEHLTVGGDGNGAGWRGWHRSWHELDGTGFT